MFRDALTLTLAVVVPAVPALAVDDTSDEALRQIEELRRQNQALAAKVERLEQVASNEGAWLTDQRAADIRTLVSDVLADASARASLQGDGATAGWNKGFFLASADGAYRLNIKGAMQFRWAGDFRNIPEGPLASGSASGTEKNYGFENRRTKLYFSGNVVDPSLTYEVKLVFQRQEPSVSSSNLPSGSSVSLSSPDVVASVEEIWMQKAFDGGWAIKAGQFKPPFLREELVSFTSQLALERTLINDTFTTKWSQGVQGEWQNDLFRLQAWYGDGLRANHVNPVTNAGVAGSYAGSYLMDFQTNDVNYAFVGRAEWKIAGTWNQFRDLNSYRGDEFGALIGVSAMAQSLRPTPTSSLSAKSMSGLAADVTLDFGGWNIFTYGVVRQVNLAGTNVVRDGGTEDSLTQWGFMVQGGVFVAEPLELYARFEYGNLDTDQFRTVANSRAADLEKDSLVTVGVAWFPLGIAHKDLKWLTDVGYAFTPIGDFNSSGANWLPDATGANQSSEDGQFVIRSQVQLTF